MLTSYLKLSLRLLARNPFFTFINVAGLSIGFAVFFILWQYSQNELKSDQQWKDWERIVRIGFVWSWTDNGTDYDQSTFGFFLPLQTKQIANDFKEITEYTRIIKQDNFSPEFVTAHGKEIFFTYLTPAQQQVSFKEFQVAYADPNFFQFFSISLKAGSPATALQHTGNIVLSEKTALKYFKETDPVGKTILLNNRIPFVVTGVFEDLPSNTHFGFDMVISSTTLGNSIERSTSSLGGPHAYLKLREDINVAELEKKIQEADLTYWRVILDMTAKTNKVQTILQPLSDLPFQSLRCDYFKSKSKFILHAFEAISLAVLLMGWINYINLSISQYARRWKEVSARVTFGAKKRDLLLQFGMEAFLINTIAILIGLTFVQLVSAPLHTFLGFDFKASQNMASEQWLILLLVSLAGIIICGFMPSLLTLNKSAIDIKRMQSPQTGRSYFQSLTVIQLLIAVVLIVWLFTMNAQMNLILQRDLGFNRNQVMLVDLPIEKNQTFKQDLASLKTELKRINGVESATSFTNITGDTENTFFVRCVYAIESKDYGCLDTNGGVDENFIPMFGITLLAGRNFLPDNPADSNSVILSRAALRRLIIKSPEDAIGKDVMINIGNWSESKLKKVTIIGVVKDYAQRSLVDNSEMKFNNGESGIVLTYKDWLVPSALPNKVAIKISDYEEASNGIEKLYRAIFPSGIYNGYWLNDHINRHYNNERTESNQLLLFTLIAIAIACLGLLGMISNKAVEKTKEIGIRKVLGAEMHQIAQILLKTTVKQIIVATVIGIPVAYYLTQQYLEKFSERITLQWWHYALPVMILVVIMFATIASVLWKAARSNPVEALKYE